MSHVASLRVSMIAVLATSLGVLTLSVPNGGAARAAETCLAAPKSTAPAGSHWYYHVDRATQQKCWHLVAAAHKGEARQDASAAPRAEAPPAPTPQPEPAAQPQAQGDAPPVTAALMKDVVQRLTQPFDAASAQMALPSTGPSSAFALASAATAAAPVPTSPAPVTDPAAPPRVATDPPAGNAAAPAGSNNADAAASATSAAPPAPVPPTAKPAVASRSSAANADAANLRMLPFAIGVLAASLLAAALVYASARRRAPTIVRIVDLNTRVPPRWSTREHAGAPLAMRAPWEDEESPFADPRAAPPSRRRAA